MSYPVLSVLPALQEQLAHAPLVMLEAPPGAGKSTVLPLALRQEPWLHNRKILVLEPRRLAARTVALRMAELLGEPCGQTVGYRVRFESCVSASTRVEVVTEGIMTRMLQSDSTLEDVGLLIFDEFHERSLQADLAFVLARQVQQVLRDDLRLLLMSATLDGDRLAERFNAPVVRTSGRTFPVTHFYLPPPADEPIALSVARAIRKATAAHTGDVLAFLPGAGEIRRTEELLSETGLVVVPLYGDLDFRRQQAAILPDAAGRRKVVLATAIAETSLTIEGIKVVVDSGYSRVPAFDPRSGLTRLQTVRVTRDAADQRAGRAGRLGPGVCYRLWAEATHQHLVAARTPEIQAADLAPLMLALLAWGVKDPGELDWVTPPPPGPVAQGFALLEQLDAVAQGVITNRGREMLRLPTHPRIAHMLIDARDADDPSLLALATDVAALLEERDPLPPGSGVDLTIRIEQLRRWRKGERTSGSFDRIEKLAAAWRKTFGLKADNAPVADTSVGRVLVAAYPERLARQIEKHGDRYKMVNGRVARLPAHDPLQHDTWLVAAQVDARQHDGKIFLAAPVDVSDIEELSRESEQVTWDTDRGMVTASREKRVGALLLSSVPLTTIPDDDKVKAICTAIREQGLPFLSWDEAHRAWQARVMSLRQWRPEEPWPDVSDEALLENLEVWLGPFLQGIHKRTEILKLDLLTMLNSYLPWELSARLDTLAPLHLPVPSGSRIRLQYFHDGRPPVMEVRLQEVFGLVETPSISEGRVRVVMHLLSPGYKPVQVTQDLKSFWSNTYAEVRKELRARYPKHAWPEDPWTAEAVRGVRRRR